jgi:hypothetical protein
VDDLISTLLLPTERPPLAVDVKRALLTFDQVNLSSAQRKDLAASPGKTLVTPYSFALRN